MAAEVIMPKLGMMMEEGTVVLWLKKQGEEVKKDEGILEIMTEKATYEIESPQDGILLKVLVGENEVQPVGHILGVVGEEDEDISDLLSRAERQKKEERKTEAPKKEEVPLKEKEGPSEPERIKISPVAKRLAKEHGVDLTRIKGSGPEGRVIRADILEAVREKKERPEEGKFLTLTGIKKLTAERMTESFKTAPHFSVSIDVEMENLLDLTKKMAPEVERKFSIHLSLTAVLIKELSGVLRDHPLMNSRFRDGKVELLEDINLNVAMATDEGLLVPVIHKSDRMSLGEIAVTLKDLTSKARSGKLSLENVSGGTFTISNLGMLGVDSFIPIINPPQAAILAVGAMKDRPLVRGGKLTVAPTATLTLVADHRVLDGVLVAKFLKSVKEILENPTILNPETK